MSLKKILINRKPKNSAWGGGNLFVKAMCENAEAHGYEVVFSFEKDLDAILMVDPRYDELGISANEIAAYKKENPNTKVVHRINECDARKGTNEMDELLRDCSKFTDETVFISEWMLEYHKEWHTSKKHVLYNGVNAEHFRPSDKAPSSPIKILTHHWSNNQLKGFDIYEKLDEWVKDNPGYEFVYIGRHRNTFKNAKITDPLYGKELGDQVQMGDVYVSASRWDPAPNHVIESLASGLPTFVHKDGGGAVELSNNEDSIFSSFEELVEKIKDKSRWPKQDVWSVSWNDCAKNYYKVIDA